jgi:hypothetical protein
MTTSSSSSTNFKCFKILPKFLNGTEGWKENCNIVRDVWGKLKPFGILCYTVKAFHLSSFSY